MYHLSLSLRPLCIGPPSAVGIFICNTNYLQLTILDTEYVSFVSFVSNRPSMCALIASSDVCMYSASIPCPLHGVCIYMYIYYMCIYIMYVWISGRYSCVSTVCDVNKYRLRGRRLFDACRVFVFHTHLGIDPTLIRLNVLTFISVHLHFRCGHVVKSVLLRT